MLQQPCDQTGPWEMRWSGHVTPCGGCRATTYRGPGVRAEAGGGTADQGPRSGQHMLAGGKRPSTSAL